MNLVRTTVCNVRNVDYRADAPRRHAVLDALRPLCGATRHTAVLRCQVDWSSTQVTFSPLGDLL